MLTEAFEEAARRYYLTSIPGWMEREELCWLYETARTMKGTVIEIGSFAGRSTCAILAGLPEESRLYCVDAFDGRGTERFDELKEYEPGWLRGEFLQNIRDRKLREPLLLEGDSASLAVRDFFLPGSIAWIFIDASHDEPSVARDLSMFDPLVRPDGLASGHDYHRTQHPGLCRAVDTYYASQSIEHPAGSIWAVRRNHYEPRASVSRDLEEKA